MADPMNEIIKYLGYYGVPYQKAFDAVNANKSAFSNVYNEYLGQGPTEDLITRYLQDALQPQKHPDLVNPEGLARGYVPDIFADQIAAYRQSQGIAPTPESILDQVAVPSNEEYKSIYDYLTQHGVSPQKAGEVLSRNINAFQDVYSNYLGGEMAGPEEINKYLSQQLGGQVHPDWVDPYQLAQSYVPNAYATKLETIQKAKAEQETEKLEEKQKQSLTENTGLLENALAGARKAGTEYYTTGAGSDILKGYYNNMGLLNSGAFSQGLGGVLGENEATLQNQAFQNFYLPTLMGLQANPQNAFNLGQSYNQSLGNLAQNQSQMIGQQNQSGRDFGIQAALLRQMLQMQQPSGAQNAIGYASAALNGVGNTMQGYGSIAQGKKASYICYELINRGILKPLHLDALHFKIFKAIPLRARAFWHYARHGVELVNAANVAGIEWIEWAPLFYDRVMAAKTAREAIDLYIDATKKLCLKVAPHLWDERVMRGSVIDSIIYTPRVLCYWPYVRAFFTALYTRRKFMETFTVWGRRDYHGCSNPV